MTDAGTAVQAPRVVVIGAGPAGLTVVGDDSTRRSTRPSTQAAR
jgi:NADPH-dependent glutamate synthase beta subunit-like oxidoreductase